MATPFREFSCTPSEAEILTAIDVATKIASTFPPRPTRTKKVKKSNDSLYTLEQIAQELHVTSTVVRKYL